MYYKMPIEQDLTNTSYRCCQYFDEEKYIEYNSGYLDPLWEKVSEETIQNLFPDWFIEADPIEEEPELSPVERLEALINLVLIQTAE